MLSIEKYIDLVLQRVEINKEDHRGLKLELTSYLNENKESYIQKGYTDTAATEQAIQDFGEVDEVGKSLSKSLFPQRTISLYGLAVTSIVFSLFLTVILFIQDIQISYIWLGTVGLLSILTIALKRRQLYIAKHRLLFIGFCFVYTLTWFYGIILMDVVEGLLIIWVLRILAVLFLVAIIVNMVLGAIYQPIKKHFSLLKIKNRVLIVTSNLISGAIVLGYSILKIFAFSIFGAADPLLFLSPVLVSTVLWLCSLLISSYRPTLALLSLGIQVCICIFIVI